MHAMVLFCVRVDVDLFFGYGKKCNNITIYFFTIFYSFGLFGGKDTQITSYGKFVKM